jgi:hypothetical protein
VRVGGAEGVRERGESPHVDHQVLNAAAQALRVGRLLGEDGWLKVLRMYGVTRPVAGDTRDATVGAVLLAYAAS